MAKHRDQLVIIKPIFDEIEPITDRDLKDLSEEKRQGEYSLRTWLKKYEFKETPIADSVQTHSLKLEAYYEIQPVSKGANQTDIILVAYAQLNQKCIVTLEAEQKEDPNKKCNYKIPLICQKEKIRYINFVQLLEKLDIRI